MPLIGDISALHDLGSLSVAPTRGAPLVIVVIDNGGGRIFEQLPIFEEPSHRGGMSHLVMPQSRDLVSVAEAFGHRGARVADVAGLREALSRALEGEGTTLIQASVPGDSPRLDRERVRNGFYERCSNGASE